MKILLMKPPKDPGEFRDRIMATPSDEPTKLAWLLFLISFDGVLEKGVTKSQERTLFKILWRLYAKTAVEE